MDRRRFIPGLVVLGLALAGGVTLAGPQPKPITCTGEIGRNVEAPTCRGTGRDDVITGSAHRDNVVAGNGDDEVDGGAGFDFILGEKGDDELHGGPNPDWLDGGPGDDRYFGGDGRDVLLDPEDTVGDDFFDGGPGDDDMEGGPGDDVMWGGPGDEVDGFVAAMQGEEGNDELHGGPGDDFLEGGAGNDAIFGDEGNDLLDGVADESAGSSDTIDCGDGFDEVLANNNDVVAADCEVVHRSPDVLAGKQTRSQGGAPRRERGR